MSATGQKQPSELVPTVHRKPIRYLSSGRGTRIRGCYGCLAAVRDTQAAVPEASVSVTARPIHAVRLVCLDARPAQMKKCKQGWTVRFRPEADAPPITIPSREVAQSAVGPAMFGFLRRRHCGPASAPALTTSVSTSALPAALPKQTRPWRAARCVVQWVQLPLGNRWSDRASEMCPISSSSRVSGSFSKASSRALRF